MQLRYLIPLLGAFALISCAEDDSNSSGPRMKQEAHTNPTTGQTTYSYRPVDANGQ